MLEDFKKALINMEEEEALDLAEKMLQQGEDPLKILDATKNAVETVGKKYEEGEYFMPELLMTGEILNQVTEKVKPHLEEKQAEEGAQKLGKVLIGTVKGDIHDIGKNIVIFMLDINGFEVKDIGEDVPPENFVEEIKNFQPDVVGMSALLTMAFDAMKETVEAINNAGLGDNVKTIIGGAPVNDEVVEYTGADGWAKNAVEAVSVLKNWVKEG